MAMIHLYVALVCFLSAQAPMHEVGQLVPAPIEHRPLPPCAEQCVTELLRNTSCARQDYTCLCNHGLVSTDVRYCFETQCMPSVWDYLRGFCLRPLALEEVPLTFSLGAQNITASDCGVPQRRQRPLLKIISISVGTLALTCVALRLLDRSVRRRTWRERIDDWIMLLNAVSYMDISEVRASMRFTHSMQGFILTFTVINTEPRVACTVVLKASLPVHEKGMGRDSYTLPFPTLAVIMKLLLIHEVLYVVIIMLTKSSVFFVYYRIFPLEVMPKMSIAIPITMGFIAAAAIGETTALIFQCVPVPYYWNRLRDARGGNCINVNAWGWANSATNVAMEIWIICLPFPELIKLKYYWKTKLRVSLMLIAGSLQVPLSVSTSTFRN
ncbi:hypothetical protein CONLIGDRAFT_646848 [Coniochaeta ligniaria NRRL 30616]|uniref:Uncharacterized protein n=1 Tax=Coniochaeta ligniaria NRRL 30616 TaxID=1408157 RepID=A0A1J7JGG1_9PEZI|nr:hypothetical protein CONLIGDRAFT_646848 [Coniochaeta ligniaria NRRL 30616]